MYQYSNTQDFDQHEHDKAYTLCVDLLSVAQQLGIADVDGLRLSTDIETEQLQTIQAQLAAAIEAADEAAREELRKMRRCPQGYKWQPEGSGWRCEGGSHYCSAEEIKKYME